MSRNGWIRFAGVMSLCLLAGCFSLADKQPGPAPAPNTAAAKAVATQKKQTLQEQKPTFNLADSLGGILMSDSWIVYQAEEKEEFTGHVSYDNGVYIFRADYALSERKAQRFTAKGNVYARHNDKNGSWYEIYANKVVYNYQTGKGRADGTTKTLVKLVYKTDKNDLLTSYAKRIDFDTQSQTYELTGNARLIYTDAQGLVSTLTADKIFVRQQDQYALLTGHAYAQRQGYTFQADTLEYDGLAHKAYGYGGRPLAQGTTEDGTFAIIADKVSSQTDSHKIHLEGNVQGWVVSEQINQAGKKK